jgi:hypothetical protein
MACLSPELGPPRCGLIFAGDTRQDRGILEMIVLISRAPAVACRVHRELEQCTFVEKAGR